MPKTTLIRKQVTPIGSIQPYGGGTIPDGWAACNGDELDRTTYNSLFSAIGTAWGIGDGSTTFNLPDLRGRFLRGTDDTSGNDPDSATRKDSLDNIVGDVVGSLQEDAIRNIEGEFSHSDDTTGSARVRVASTSGVFSIGADVGDASDFSGQSVNGQTAVRFDASDQVPTGSDNRPKNAAVKYIIRIE
jgi:microcystin-dependent protein